VLPQTLVDALLAGDARVLAVHVVADEPINDRRLRARAAGGGAVDRQLASRCQRGEMKASIFESPGGVGGIVEIDTSGHGDPVIGPVEAAFIALLATGRARSGRRTRTGRCVGSQGP
jgi:hypothetical protein